MVNITTTNLDTGRVDIFNNDYTDEVLTHAGAGTIFAGTLLARINATDKLVVYVKGGIGELDVPVAVLSVDSVATGAGDERIRPVISGNVRFDKLIIAADGDNSNLDKTVRDQLRDFSIVVQDNIERMDVDNPQP